MEVNRARQGSSIVATPIKSSQASIKGRPLASRSHTVQIFIMLSLNNILLLMCLFILPAHLLWRRALKHHLTMDHNSASATNSTSLSESFALNAIVSANANSNSAIRNIITAFRLLFKIPAKDVIAVKWIRHGFRSALAALFLSQGWFIARLKGWWDEADAMEQGDREEVLKRRRIGISKQMENVTLSSFALPLPIAGWYILLILCGAPATRDFLDTLFLATYISVLLFLPAFALLGTDENQWKTAFTFSIPVKVTARYKLIRTQAACMLLGALIGSAGHILDWERAWQIYPIPTLLGACLGIIFGNTLGFLAYYNSLPSASPKIERPAKPIFSNADSKKKKKKKQK